VTEAKAALPARLSVVLRPAHARAMLGIAIDASEMHAILRRLGMQIEQSGESLRVTPPSFRFDIEIEEDLIEEVARVHGYDAIPATPPVAPVQMLPLPEERVPLSRLKKALVARDYLEVVTFSFVDRTLESDFAGEEAPVALLNPIAASMSVMRSTLLGSLVETVRYNAARRQERMRIFEAAACFSRTAEGFGQTQRLTGLCYGPAHAEQWGRRSRPVDFFDVRGDLEAVLGAQRLRFEQATHPALHPGQCARVLVDGTAAGWLGAVHPRLLQKYELAAAVVAFELDLACLDRARLPHYEPISRFQPVRRDLAFLVGAEVAAGAVAEAIAAAGAPLVRAVTLFDVYAGEGLPDGRKSLAFRVLLQDTEKTLTEAEVEQTLQRILQVLQEKYGATLRG
jgi:phenylalanyl-tRNA synthetase beta chain